MQHLQNYDSTEHENIILNFQQNRKNQTFTNQLRQYESLKEQSQLLNTFDQSNKSLKIDIIHNPDSEMVCQTDLGNSFFQEYQSDAVSDNSFELCKEIELNKNDRDYFSGISFESSAQSASELNQIDDMIQLELNSFKGLQSENQLDNFNQIDESYQQQLIDHELAQNEQICTLSQDFEDSNTITNISKDNLDVSQYFATAKSSALQVSNSFQQISKYEVEESYVMQTQDPTMNIHLQKISKLDQFLVGQRKHNIPNLRDVPTSCDLNNDLTWLTRNFLFLDSIYTKNFYQYCKITLCGKNLDEYYCWNDQLPTSPLSQLDGSLFNMWNQCITSIFKYAQSASYQYAQDLIQTLFDYTVLIDEVYFIILKQIIGNPTNTQTVYCQLLIFVATCMTPSQKAFYHIIEFLYHGTQQYKALPFTQHQSFDIGIQNLEIANQIRFALFRLIKTMGKKRMYPPSIQELELTSMGKQILVPLQLYQDNEDYFSIEPHCTERQFMDQITTRYDIQHLKEFLGISNIVDGRGQFLDEQSLIVDYLKQHEDSKSKLKCNLALRIKIFYDHEEADEDSNCLYFITASEQYIQYILSEDDLYNLSKSKIYAENEVIIGIPNNIPTRKQARISFIKILQNQELSKAWIFNCQTIQNSIQRDQICAIYPNQIIFHCKQGGPFSSLEILDINIWNLQGIILTLSSMKSGNLNITFYNVHDSQACEQILKAYIKSALSK